MSKEALKANDMLLKFEGISAMAARMFASSGNPAYLRIQVDAETSKQKISRKLNSGFYNATQEAINA